MAAMIRICPNCETERPLEEFYCGGVVNGSPCSWDLSSAPIHEAGRPRRTLVSVPPQPALVCTNGHPVVPGDLLCSQCGADVASAPSPDRNPATDGAKQVGDWILGRALALDQSRKRAFYRYAPQ